MVLAQAFLVLFVSVLTFADPKPCAMDANDPFDPAQAAPRGHFKGQCLDASSVRPVQKISEDDKILNVANFYHRGRFWRAVVPKLGVREVLYQIVPFDSGVPLIQAAHTQFRFRMADKIYLRPQSSAAPAKGAALDSDAPQESIEDVIVSSTFTAPTGQAYSALRSLGDSYGIVTRLMSSVDRGREEILGDGSTVRQFKLKLSPDEMNRLLVVSIERASDAYYTPTYALLSNNCATIAFDALDVVRTPPTGVPPMRGSLGRIFDEFVEPSLKALRDRNLIDEKIEITPMNDEMSCVAETKQCSFKSNQ